MEKIIIEPHVGIGKIKLGMTEDQVDTCIQEYVQKYNQDIFIHVFKIGYDSENKVNFIEIGNLSQIFHCVFNDIDLFNTKASEIVKLIDEISPYNRDNEDTILGYTYEFPELGLSFWRDNVLFEEDLEKDWFKELEPEVQQDIIQDLYFDSVSIRRTT